MVVDLKFTISEEYFKETGEKIDWEGKGKGISVSEAEAIQKILTCEVSIFLLRRAYGIDGSLVDDMVSIRRDFINQYQNEFAKNYLDYNGESIY